MGVLGLAPFLLKSYPEVVKQIPDRLRGIAGKTIVIDGTLITQRFHFAQAPHPYRHVLGWYRLIQELNEAGVSTICVFDGKERHVAKAQETLRRRMVRRITAARSIIETERLQRLSKLSNTLQRFQQLDTVARARVTDLLRQLRGKDTTTAGSEVPECSALLAERHLAGRLCTPERTTDRDVGYVSEYSPHDLTVLTDRLSITAAEQDALMSLAEETPPLADAIDAYYDISDKDMDSEFMNADAFVSTDEFDNTWLPPATTQVEPRDDFGGDSLPPVNVDSTVEPPISSSPIDFIVPQNLQSAVPEVLSSLYVQYRRSVSKLVTLDTSLETTIIPSSLRDDEAQVEHIITKTQHHLTLEEGKIWDRLVMNQAPTDFSEALPPPETVLEALTRTSHAMLESYRRRANLPSPQTYAESREILSAMGIPCLDTSGAFEAEALASSIVLSGLADYVASEDTDVLVYGAPLLRNLTSRQEPLVIMSGGDVHAVLDLDRPSFIDFALLLGTDFSQRIKNVGPARALKFIKEHRSIERVIELETKYPPRLPQEAYLAQVEAARTVFQTLPPIPGREALEQHNADAGEVSRVLQRYGLGKIAMTTEGWDYESALQGNYFGDNPSAS